MRGIESGFIREWGVAMESWFSRTVFFVKDAERSVAFYRDKLGCELDWNYEEEGRSVVCQVNRQGLKLILAAQDDRKAGQGRVFITHFEEAALRKEIAERGVEAEDDDWGMPVIVIEDPDGNQLLFARTTPTSRRGA
jgi:catechol 2,3-dioxygenase-like lactoylglutathione lyase family enzyme